MNLLKQYKYGWALVLAAILYGCANTSSPLLTKSGPLKMGVYKGSPTSIVQGKTIEDTRGVGYELGRALANDFDYAYAPIIFDKNADVLAAAKQGRVDMIFTNATPERLEDFAFSNPVLKIEKGYLLGSQRGILSLADIDISGRKIGVSEGSSSQKELSKIIKNAQIITTSSTTSAIAMLKAGRIDAFSSNKAILFEMSDSIPGSRVLADVIGYESMAIGVPKDRAAAIPKVNLWIDSMNTSGKLAEIVTHSGLRGVAPQIAKP